MANEVPRQTPGANADPNGNPLVPTIGFLRVKSNEILDEEAKAQAASKTLLDDQEANNSLGQMIETRFKAAENAKDYQTDRLMDSLRRRKGEYSAAHLAEIRRQGGSEIFMKLTEIKCNAAEAWISDVVIPVEGKPWGLSPTPKPDLPPQVLQSIVAQTLSHFEEQEFEGSEEEIREVAGRLRDEAWTKIREDAKRRANRMENLIDDEFTEGDLVNCLDESISDMVTFGTMIVKGPFVQLEKTLEWLEDEDWTPDVTTLPMMKFKRTDPLNFFPSPGASTIEDAIYLIERDDFTRHALASMRGNAGYNSHLIDLCLQENQKGTTIPLRTDSEQATLEDRQGHHKLENPDDKFQGLWYSGQCEGRLLKEWGVTGLDEQDTYEIVALKIGSYVIHARLNPDPLGKRNYCKAIYKRVKGSFWGEGVPGLMDDSQDACNSTARHLINNLAIGSGPQATLRDVESLAEGEDITSMYPWKIWQFNDPQRTGKSPLDFYQPNIYTDKLIRVFEFFLKIADDETGIPKYEYGRADTTGAGRTATGLSMLMNSASRVLKKSIQNIDQHVFNPMIERAFVWNMLYVDDPSIKGDVRIEATGAMGIFVKEQRQLRLQEYMKTTDNESDRAIIGVKGRAELLRAGAKGLEVPVEKVVPTDAELEEKERVGVEGGGAPPASPAAGPVALPPAAMGAGVVAPTA